MKELKIKKIKNGTVIDHISPRNALYVLDILNEPSVGNVVSLAMNVSSEFLGKKDIVKIENRELNPKEVNKISLIAPYATINIIEEYEVVEKYKVELLPQYKDILKCPNPSCITNMKYPLGNSEPVKTIFELIKKDPLTLRCHYCERFLENDIHKYLK